MSRSTVGSFKITAGDTTDQVVSGVGFLPSQLAVQSSTVAPPISTSAASARGGVAGFGGDGSHIIYRGSLDEDPGASSFLLDHIDNVGNTLQAFLFAFTSDGFVIRITANNLTSDVIVMWEAFNNA